MAALVIFGLKSDLRGIETLKHPPENLRKAIMLKSDLRGIETYFSLRGKDMDGS